MCTFSTREWASPSSCTQVMGAVQPGWGSFFPGRKRVHTGGHPSCAQVHTWMSARSKSNPTFAQTGFEPTTLDSPGKFPPYWAPTTQVFVCCISHSFQQDSVILKLYSPSDDIMPLSAKSAAQDLNPQPQHRHCTVGKLYILLPPHHGGVGAGTDLYSWMHRPTRIFG